MPKDLVRDAPGSVAVDLVPNRSRTYQNFGPAAADDGRFAACVMVTTVRRVFTPRGCRFGSSAAIPIPKHPWGAVAREARAYLTIGSGGGCRRSRPTAGRAGRRDPWPINGILLSAGHPITVNASRHIFKTTTTDFTY